MKKELSKKEIQEFLLQKEVQKWLKDEDIMNMVVDMVRRYCDPCYYSGQNQNDSQLVGFIYHKIIYEIEKKIEKLNKYSIHRVFDARTQTWSFHDGSGLETREWRLRKMLIEIDAKILGSLGKRDIKKEWYNLDRLFADKELQN